MFTKYLKNHRSLLLVIVIFVLLRLPSLFEPYWYGDEGIYLVIGRAINKGVVLYRQIHDNKPPTLYYLAAFSQTVFGFRLLLSLWMIPTIYFFYRLVNKILTPGRSYFATLIFLILTSIPLFEGNIANAEIFMLLPTIIAFLLMFRSQSWTSVVYSGLLLGFAFTIKIPVLVEFGFLFLWLLMSAINHNSNKLSLLPVLPKLFVFFIAFVTPIFAYLFYFINLQAVNEFLFSAIQQNFGYLSSWSSGSHSGSATSGGLVTRGMFLLVSWASIYYLMTKKFISKELSFLCFWFTATVFGALLSTRPYPHYLIQILPPLVILFTYSFETSTTKKANYLVAVLLLGFVAIFFRYRFYVYPVLSYYQNFYTNIFNLKSPKYRQFFGSRVNDTYQISKYIATNSNPSDKIFVWGDEPYIYALANRLPASKYTVSYHISDFNQYKYVYNQLTINFPKFIIYYPQTNRPFPELDIFISRYYMPIETVGQAIIYQVL